MSENAVSSSCNTESQSTADSASVEPPVPAIANELGENVLSTFNKFKDRFVEKYTEDVSAVKRKQWVGI